MQTGCFIDKRRSAVYTVDGSGGNAFAHEFAERSVMTVKTKESDEKENAATVLLLDDDSIALMLGRKALCEAGYNVISLPDALQGLAVLSEDRDIELIVTDNKMPGMTGIELAETLYSKHITLPVILVSSDLDERVVARGQEIGIKGFLEKPYRVEDFQGMVKTVLDIYADEEP